MSSFYFLLFFPRFDLKSTGESEERACLPNTWNYTELLPYQTYHHQVITLSDWPSPSYQDSGKLNNSVMVSLIRQLLGDGMCLPMCVSVYVYTCVYICLCVYLCVYLSICLPACLSIYVSTCVSVCLSFCLPVCVAVYASTCVCVCLCVYLCLCLLKEMKIRIF